MKLLHLNLLGILLSSCIINCFEKIQYSFFHDPIDVVIPCHEKDAHTVERAIESIKKYVKDIRRIMVVSAQPFTDKAEWIDETIFPFTKQSIALHIFKSQSIALDYANRQGSRIGWMYQQLLKLYAPFSIPDISSNVLIVDADVVFLKPVTFLQENGAGLYAVGTCHHEPYFEHAARLLPDLKKVYPAYSGIVHHMLFQRPVLEDLFALIEEHHKVEPWIAFAQSIALLGDSHIYFSALSEYEIYFNFVFARTDQVKIRNLHWDNISQATFSNPSLVSSFDFVAIHIDDLQVNRYLPFLHKTIFPKTKRNTKNSKPRSNRKTLR